MVAKEWPESTRGLGDHKGLAETAAQLAVIGIDGKQARVDGVHQDAALTGGVHRQRHLLHGSRAGHRRLGQNGPGSLVVLPCPASGVESSAQAWFQAPYAALGTTMGSRQNASRVVAKGQEPDFPYRAPYRTCLRPEMGDSCLRYLSSP